MAMGGPSPSGGANAGSSIAEPPLELASMDDPEKEDDMVLLDDVVHDSMITDT